MASEFVPDIIFGTTGRSNDGHKCELSQEVEIYLNGELLKTCLEARVKYASFEGPAFGELVVFDNENSMTALRPPRLGEFEIDGAWCRFACGQVEIKLTERGKEILELIKKVSK